MGAKGKKKGGGKKKEDEEDQSVDHFMKFYKKKCNELGAPVSARIKEMYEEY
jgi:hypothetical protein